MPSGNLLSRSETGRWQYSEQGSGASGNADWFDVPSVGSESVLSALRAAMYAGGVGRTERRPIPAGALMAEMACGKRSVALGGLAENCLDQVSELAESHLLMELGWIWL